MNICCRLIFVVAFSILSNVIFGQACEERTVIDGYLVIKNSKYTVVTVPDGPENLSDYSASYMIADEYKRIYAENAANKDWLKKIRPPFHVRNARKTCPSACSCRVLARKRQNQHKLHSFPVRKDRYDSLFCQKI